MRAWWSDYGAFVISGIVLGGLALFGYNYYQDSLIKAQEEASALYGELTNHVVDAKLDEAEVVAGQLQADFPDSPYATQAKLALARLYMDQNRDQDAADVLTELLGGNASDAFKHVARVRLAKVLMYQDKAEEVVALLTEQDEEGAFAARYADTLGDAYVMLGRHSDARAAFQRALTEPQTQASVDQQYIQFKLLDLPVEAFESEPAAAEDESAEGAEPAESSADTVEDTAPEPAEPEEGGDAE